MAIGDAILAGAAETDITPPMRVEMCGYGPYEKRVCTEVLDPLHARALWLECGEEAVAIVTLDLVGVNACTRDAAARALHEQCGIAPDNVFVSASHTHSGPATAFLLAWGEQDPDYMRRLPGMIVDAAMRARSSREPVRIGACRRRVTNVGVNREQPDFGPLDTAAQLMRIDTMGGEPLAVLFNFGAHAVTRYPFTSRISADWPGLAAARLQYSLGARHALFLQAPCGNINGHEVLFGRADRETYQKVADMHAGAVAESFTDQVLPALESLETRPTEALSSQRAMVELACVRPDGESLEQVIRDNERVAGSMTLLQLRPLHERMEDESPEERAWRQARFMVDQAQRQLALIEDAPSHVTTPVHVLRVGDAAIVGWPGEVFVELGIELRQRSPVPLTFVASFANDYVGYIPTRAAYESRGRPHEFGVYPTSRTPGIVGNLPFRSDVGEILLDETLKLLDRA